MRPHLEQRASSGGTRNEERTYSVAGTTRVKLGIGDRACRKEIV